MEALRWFREVAVMSNGLAILILMLSALAALLAGMSVFSNSRPPDARLNLVMDELDELKGLLNQIQKSILQLERKSEKDQKEAKAEIKEILEQVGARIDKRLQEIAE
jgi:Na+-transporting methylmalonyl-CoA/oxaloacetate decarboxylase gamma subunit